MFGIKNSPSHVKTIFLAIRNQLFINVLFSKCILRSNQYHDIRYNHNYQDRNVVIYETSIFISFQDLIHYKQFRYSNPLELLCSQNIDLTNIVRSVHVCQMIFYISSFYYLILRVNIESIRWTRSLTIRGNTNIHISCPRRKVFAGNKHNTNNNNAIHYVSLIIHIRKKK